VAIKKINLPKVKKKKETRQVLIDEVEMMKSFHHPNVIQYFGIISKETSEISIILEYVDGEILPR